VGAAVGATVGVAAGAPQATRPRTITKVSSSAKSLRIFIFLLISVVHFCNFYFNRFWVEMEEPIRPFYKLSIIRPRKPIGKLQLQTKIPFCRICRTGFLFYTQSSSRRMVAPSSVNFSTRFS